MRVRRARYAGACYGVQRALDLALEASHSTEGASTLGPLIHNPQVVDELAARGILVVDEVESVSCGSVIIRSHGVTPEVRRQVIERNLPLIDATCPHVARAQKAAGELAARCGFVIVVGEKGHPEVEGLVACAHEAGGKVVVVTESHQLPLDMYGPVGIVVQTTQTREALEAVISECEKRNIKREVKNTICSATRLRQESAAELADEVDAIVVIGGRNSSNTTRLAEICAASCVRSFHIEAPEELNSAWFEGCEVVGVTAGASTPESQIAAVVQRLEKM